MTADPAARVFALIASIAGLVFTFITPPFQVPDEVGHVWRAVSISYGDIVPPTDKKGSFAALPNGIRMLPFAMGSTERTITWNHFRNSRHLALAENDRRMSWFPGFYTPIPYLPQIAAALLGRGLNLLPIATFYLGRLFNLAAFIAVVWWTIRSAPVGKWVFCVAATLPMSLSLAASWSPDALTIALAFLFISRLLGPAEAGPHALLGFVFGLCKPAYFLIAFLALAQEKKRTAMMIIGASLLGSTLSLANAAHAWYPRPDVPVDSAAQRLCLTEDPIRVARLLGSHLFRYRFEYPEQMIGRLGLLEGRLPGVVIWSELLLLLASALAVEMRMRPAVRIISLGIFLLTVTGVFVSMFLGYSRACDLIEGVQGRYFLPVLPLLLIAVSFPIRAVERLMPILTLGVAVATNAMGVSWLVWRYYY